MSFENNNSFVSFLNITNERIHRIENKDYRPSYKNKSVSIIIYIVFIFSIFSPIIYTSANFSSIEHRYNNDCDNINKINKSSNNKCMSFESNKDCEMKNDFNIYLNDCYYEK